MKTRALFVISIGLFALLVFQPSLVPAARAQDSGPGYIDYLATQVALNTQATLTAYQQQQDAAVANANAAAAQAAAQQAAANAAYAAQQATLQAGQVQTALIAAQSTADAAALLATAQVQQTRTAIDLSAQQTKTASDIQATATARAIEIQTTSTARAIDVQRTKAALEATRVARESEQADLARNNAAVATAVAMSLRATQTAITAQAQREAERSEFDRQALLIVLGVICIVAFTSGALSLWLMIRTIRRADRQAAQSRPSGKDVIDNEWDEFDREMARRMVAFRLLYREQMHLLLTPPSTDTEIH